MKKQVVITLILPFVFAACTQAARTQNTSVTFQQGKAEWLTSESQKAETPTAQELRQMSYQQVVNDLKIIPSLNDLKKVFKKVTAKARPEEKKNTDILTPTLAESLSEDLLTEVNMQRMTQQPYQITQVRKVIDQLKLQDQKINLTIQLYNKKSALKMNQSVC